MRRTFEYRLPRAGEVMMFLDRHATKVERGQGANMRFSPCPKCKRDVPLNVSNTIHVGTGLWFCWACKGAGNFFTLTRDFGYPLPEGDRYLNPPELERTKIDAGWRELRSKGEAHQRRPVIDGHYPALLEYLHGRGFSSETIDDWRVSTMGPKVLRWPIYALSEDASEWVVCNARLRVVIDREKAKTKDWFEVVGGETSLMLGNHLIDTEDKECRVLITEGQFDAMTAYEIGFRNVLSLPNGAAHVDVSRMLRYIPDTWEVWLASDMDAAGDQCAESFFAALGPERLARIYMPYKDLNDWYRESGFKLTKGDIQECLTSRKIQAASSGKRKWLNLRERKQTQEKPKPICDTPWEALSALLDGGPKRGQTTGLLAASGGGKTTIVTQWGIHTAARGIRTGMLSLEGDRASVEAKIFCTVDNYGEVDQARIIENFCVSELHGLGVKWADALAEIKELLLSGCELIVMDNLDCIMPRADLNLAMRLKTQAYAQLVDLAQSHQAHILVVWQPVKIDKDVLVNSGHQKGVSQIFQDSDNYLNLNQVDGLVRLEIEKCRDIGGKGGHCWLSFDPDKRCFETTEERPGTGSAVREGFMPIGFFERQE